jgi:acetyltransferase-like isoleucine patch superfamily enzyme
MLSSIRLYFVFLGFKLFPETRLFELKRKLLNFAGANIEKKTRICSSFKLSGTGTFNVGSETWIGHEVLIVASSAVFIGSNVDVAPCVFIGTGTHEIDPSGARIAGKGKSEEIRIGNGAWIGARSTILPGVTIGEMAIVGAGSLVLSDVPSRSIVAGVPAKIIKKVDRV